MTKSVAFDKLIGRGLGRNVGASVIQSMVNAACVFLSYRIVTQHAGLEAFGVWSIVLSLTLFVRVVDVTGASALSRFLALPDGQAFGSKGEVFSTVIVSTFFLNLALAAIVLFGLPLLLPKLLEQSHLELALALVPGTALLVVVGALAGAASGALVGLHRADLRALVMITSSALALVANALLVPRFGLTAYIASLLLQNAFVFLASWAILRRTIPEIGLAPTRWNRAVFTATARYAAKLNVGGVMVMAFDPVLKIALNAAGGVETVALFELGNRLVTHVRFILIAATTPLVPALAGASGAIEPSKKILLGKITKVASLSGVLIVVVSLGLSPVVSWIVLGRFDHELNLMVTAMSLAWGSTMPFLGLYLAGQACGILKWNIVSHALPVAVLALANFTIVPAFGLVGLLGALIASMMAGGFVIALGNGWQMRVLDAVLDDAALIAVSLSAMALIAAASIFLGPHWSS